MLTLTMTNMWYPENNALCVKHGIEEVKSYKKKVKKYFAAIFAFYIVYK